MVTTAQLKAQSRTGEFNDLTPSVLQSALDEAACSVGGWSLNTCGDDPTLSEKDRGQLLLAAHILLDTAGAGTGGIAPEMTSQRLGPASAQFRTGPSTRAEEDHRRLRSSHYGRRYLSLERVQVATLTTGF